MAAIVAVRDVGGVRWRRRLTDSPADSDWRFGMPPVSFEKPIDK